MHADYIEIIQKTLSRLSYEFQSFFHFLYGTCVIVLNAYLKNAQEAACLATPSQRPCRSQQRHRQGLLSGCTPGLFNDPIEGEDLRSLHSSHLF
jgi:hypothetical protein